MERKQRARRNSAPAFAGANELASERVSGVGAGVLAGVTATLCGLPRHFTNPRNPPIFQSNFVWNLARPTRPWDAPLADSRHMLTGASFGRRAPSGWNGPVIGEGTSVIRND